MATSSSSVVAVSQVWPLEKYARFLPEESGQVLPQKKDSAKKGGSWKCPWGGLNSLQHYQSTRDYQIQMTLLASNHLMISSGTQIYESFSLWNSQKWIKGVTKGDSILFIYKLNDQNRRFRIKFSQTSTKSSSEACKNCITCLAPLVSIREMDVGQGSSATDSQLHSGYDDSQMLSQQTQQTAIHDPQPELATASQQPLRSCGSTEPGQPTVNRGIQPPSRDLGDSLVSQKDSYITVPNLAKSVSEGKPLGITYASTNFPTEQLGAFIRLCLTDSNFPGFVEAVERELNSIK